MTLLKLAAAFIVGVFLASRIDPPLAALGLFVISSALVTALLVNLRRSLMPALFVLVLLLGMFRVELFESSQPPDLIAHHSRLPVEVEGVVIDDPEPAGVFTRLRLRVEKIKLGDEWVGVSDDALVTLRESTELVRLRDKPYFRYGDRLLLEGRLEAPPVIEDFDYPAYLARQGITTVMSFPDVTLLDERQGNPFYQWLYGVRYDLAESLTKTVPEPQASLGQALLLGIRDNLPDDLVDEFQRTGTSHVLAISGLHIGILLYMVLMISSRIFGRRHQGYLIMLALIVTWSYALVSGASPSAIRASIMGTVYLLALAVGRPNSTLPALGFAATIMVAISPDVLRSVSFQLSFAAMAGIAVLAEPLSNRIKIFLSNWPTAFIWLADVTAITIAATVATLPLVAFYFERVSLIGILSTVLVLPALPAVLISQVVAGVVGLWSATIAQPIGWFAWAATGYVTGVVGLLARIPGVSVGTGSLASTLVWTYYAILITIVLAIVRVRVLNDWFEKSSLIPSSAGFSRAVSLWIIIPIIGVAAITWTAAQFQSDSRLHVAFVDVGQGDAIFIETPGGKQIIIDGGPDPADIVGFLGERMAVNDRTIDLVVLSHAHADHVSGLTEVLNRYDVERILERQIEYSSPPYEAWRRAVSVEEAEVIQATSGQIIDFGDGVILQVVSPPERLLRGTESDTDNASVAIRIVYGDVSFLLTGDMFGEAERALVRNEVMIDSDVLKVAHHGSRSSSTRNFLEEVSPAIAVISAGEDNRFGHPHPEVVDALRRHVPDDLLFMTKDRGAIEIVTDGKSIEIKTER